MVSHVLVPVDGSPQSLVALSFVVDEWPDADVTLLHVIDPVSRGGRRGVMPSGSEAWYQNAKEHAQEVFAEALAEVDVDADTRTEVGRPSRTIVETAEEGGVDHVVMGSHGRSGVSRILLGSTAENVVRRSTVPVTIVR